MTDMRDYRKLTHSIKAPDELKEKVIVKSRRMGKRPADEIRFHARPARMLAQVAVVVLIIAVLSVTAFAVARSMSLSDRLSEHGTADREAIESLSSDKDDYNGEQLIAFAEDEYAEYKVLEGVCDSQTIFVHAQIIPKDDKTMFIAQDISPDDPADFLGIPGVNEGTVEDYAGAGGKTLRYANFVLENIDGVGLTSEYDEDGSLHIYLRGANTGGATEITVKCSAFTNSIDNMQIIDPSERTSFEAVLQNKSSLGQALVFTKFDSRIKNELGITIEKLSFEETELCYYASFTYRAEHPENVAAFTVVDENGEYFQVHGLGSSSFTDNGDGSFTYTDPVPIVEHPEKLMFRIVDANFDKSGPFGFEP